MTWRSDQPYPNAVLRARDEPARDSPLPQQGRGLSATCPNLATRTPPRNLHRLLNTVDGTHHNPRTHAHRRHTNQTTWQGLKPHTSQPRDNTTQLRAENHCTQQNPGNLRRRTPRGKYGEVEEGSWSPAWVSDRYPPPLPPCACAYVVYPPIPFPRVGGASQLLSTLHTYARMQQLLSAASPAGIPYSHYPLTYFAPRLGNFQAHYLERKCQQRD